MVKNKKFQVVTALIVVALLLFGGLFALREARKPAPIPDYLASERLSEAIVVIPEGATGDQIAKLLFDKKVVKSVRAFFAAATVNENSKKIQPGTYRIERHIPGKEAVLQLLQKDRRLMVLLIREGERGYELADELEKLNYSKEAIKEFFQEKVLITNFGEHELEGFLYPATYNLTPGESISSVRKRLIDKFAEIIAELNFVTEIKEKNLTPYEGLIIASIVQGEGYSEDDFKKISRVIFNRLSVGMPLQMDSTVLYALKERRIALSNRDISLSSSYNTYNKKGLPPTPIGNPGKAALAATLAPEPGDWLYFVTVAPSETKFTASYKEFLQFKREFKKNLKAGLFGENR